MLLLDLGAAPLSGRVNVSFAGVESDQASIEMTLSQVRHDRHPAGTFQSF